MVNVKNNLTGQIFGNFLVLQQAEDYVSPGGQHRAQWLCKCLLCGNDKVVIMDRVLYRNSKKSCGCLNDLTGRKFGRLMVVGKDRENDSKNTFWVCKCDCGKYISVAHSRLTSENVKSCGCLRSDLAKEKFSKKNVYDLSGDYGIGWTTNTNREFCFDLEDYHLISDYAWFEDIASNGYASLRARDKDEDRVIKMHYLFGMKYCDHADRNALNNRRLNLRDASAQDNARNRSVPSTNTSGIIGVCLDKESNKWLSYIKIDGKQIKLGRFVDKLDAIKTRLEAEKKYYGKFAPQRHLFKEYGIEDEFLEENNEH